MTVIALMLEHSVVFIIFFYKSINGLSYPHMDISLYFGGNYLIICQCILSSHTYPHKYTKNHDNEACVEIVK